jgi:hypothetical protein
MTGHKLLHAMELRIDAERGSRIIANEVRQLIREHRTALRTIEDLRHEVKEARGMLRQEGQRGLAGMSRTCARTRDKERYARRREVELCKA